MEQLVQSIQYKYEDSKDEVNELKQRYESKITQYIQNLKNYSTNILTSSEDSTYLTTVIFTILSNIKEYKLDFNSVNDIIANID